MTIGIDIRVLARGTRTGIEEYVLNLLPRLLPLDRGIKYKLFYNAFRKVKLNYSWLDLPNVELKKFTFPNRILNFFMSIIGLPRVDKLLGPPAGEAGEVDLFFSPHFLPVALSKKCQRIITFHDLSFEHHPQFFSFSRKLWHFLTFPKQQTKGAIKIIADSHSTKEDLIKIYNADSKKIKVIYLGISKDFRPIKNSSQFKKIREKYGLPASLVGGPEKFILYFGTIEPRKNLISIIKAFEFLKKDRDNLKLVIAGAKGWLCKDIFKAVKNSKYKKDIFCTGFFEDKDKPCLYNLAEVFVYPSFFEGFGFPPLEAMACGTPTIVSDASSLPEVVGDGAIMIDPYNVDELSLAIKEILEDKELKEDLIKKGLKQAKKFDWDKTAKQVLELFKKL